MIRSTIATTVQLQRARWGRAVASAVVREDELMRECPVEISSARLLLRPYRSGEGCLYVDMSRENCAHLAEFMPEELHGISAEADGERHI